MTVSDWLTDDLIEATFARRAQRPAPDDLRREILTAATASSQRAAWRVRLDDALATPALRPAWIAILVLAALLGAALAVALVGQRAQPAHQGLLAYIQDGDVYLAHPDGSGAIRVVHDDGVTFSAPLWAPGGRWLAVEGTDGEFILDAETLALRRVLTVPASGMARVWSSDGESLAVAASSADGATTTIDIVTIDPVAVRELQPKLAAGASLGQSLAWSPDGHWFLASTYPTACQSGCTPGGERMVRIDATTGDAVDVAPIRHYGVFSADWSPDSRRFAYADAGGCATEVCLRTIAVVDADLAHRVTITDPATLSANPRWSPDGTWIAFTSNSLRQPVASRGTYPSTLSIVRPDGRDARVLVTFADEVAAIAGFSWGADGEGVVFSKVAVSGGTSLGAFEVQISDGSLRQILPPGLDGYAWQANPIGRPVQSLPNRPPTFAPPPESSVPLRSPPPAPPADPSQSWSGIAFDGYCNAGVLDLRTLRERIVGLACSGDLLFAPAGAAYAFAEPDQSVSVVRSDGSISSALEAVVGVPANGYGEVKMAWSPDGRWLSVRRCAEQSNDGCTRFEDLVISPDGLTRHELPATPAWSSDGRKLVVDDGGNLLVGSPDGSNLRSIGSFPMPRSWSPDGAQFAFIRDGDAWIANADGTDTRNVAHFEYGGASDAVWSPDGRFIAVIQGSRLIVVSAAGGDPLPVDLGPGRIAFKSVVANGSKAVAWSPDGTRLAVEVDRSGTPATIIVRASDWTATVLNGDAIDLLAWSPDGRFIALKGFATGVLAVANSDGSGRHTLWKAPDSTAGMTWVP